MKKKILCIIVVFSLACSSGGVSASLENEALVCYVNGDYKCAKEKCETAITNENSHMAALLLGCMYNDGNGVVQDNDEAINYLQKSIYSGHLNRELNAEAAFNIGMAYHNKVIESYWANDESHHKNLENRVIWLKVAASYGKDEYTTIKGNKHTVQELISSSSYAVAQRGRSIAECTKAAKVIRKKIDGASERCVPLNYIIKTAYSFIFVDESSFYKFISDSFAPTRKPREYK